MEIRSGRGHDFLNKVITKGYIVLQVFSGSVFEGAPHAPTMLLKLIYHWSCQTNVQNITQWVKIDNFYVKSFFTNLRSICTAAVHEKFEKLGGNKKKVEVSMCYMYNIKI